MDLPPLLAVVAVAVVSVLLLVLLPIYSSAVDLPPLLVVVAVAVAVVSVLLVLLLPIYSSAVDLLLLSVVVVVAVAVVSVLLVVLPVLSPIYSSAADLPPLTDEQLRCYCSDVFIAQEYRRRFGDPTKEVAASQQKNQVGTRPTPHAACLRVSGCTAAGWLTRRAM